MRPFLKEKLKKFTSAKINGVEPNWSLKLFETYILLTPNMGEAEIRFEIKGIWEAPKGLFILAENNNSSINLNITEETCSDGMSDNSYPLKVRVVLGNKVLNGCGRY